MTILIDRTRAARSIHVLIVGVGRYEQDKLEALAGLGEAVRRLYDWWRDEAPSRCLDGWSVGTVAVLASAEAPISLVDGNHQSVVPDEPTYGKVESSLQAWLDRVRAGGRGYLHWCGHGAMQGLDAGHGIQTLFCQDLADDGELYGLDWRETEDGLNGKCDDSQVVCFVDACRTPSEHLFGRRYGVPFQQYRRRPDRTVAVHYSAVEGAVALSFRRAIPAAGFPGGPIGTEAQQAALDRYGAFERRDCMGYAVNSVSLAEAIACRMRRIGGHIRGLGPEWKPTASGPVPSWGWDPLLAMPTPHALMDIEPPSSESVVHLECTVTACAGAATVTVEASEHRFETSVPYGEYDIVVVDRSASSGTPLRAERLNARLPLHQVRTRRDHP